MTMKAARLGQRRSSIRRCSEALPLAFLFVASTGVEAASAYRSNKEGTRLYNGKQYEDAFKKYAEAQAARPDLSELKYNEADALYKMGKNDEAAKLFNEASALSDPRKKESALYNLGNALFMNNDLENAIKAYVSALRLDPSDRQAKVNLEMALRRQQEQQNQQQQKQQSPPPPQEEKQKPPDQQEDMEQKQVEALLDYLKDKESKDMKRQKQQKKLVTPPVSGKDW